jgi:hypothetical protein
MHFCQIQMNWQQQEDYFLSREEQWKILQYTVNKEGRDTNRDKSNIHCNRWALHLCEEQYKRWSPWQILMTRTKLGVKFGTGIWFPTAADMQIPAQCYMLRTSTTKYKMMAHAPWQHGFDNSPNLTCLQVVRVRQLERLISIILNTSIWFVRETWKANRPAKVARLDYRSHWSGGALYIYITLATLISSYKKTMSITSMRKAKVWVAEFAI